MSRINGIPGEAEFACRKRILNLNSVKMLYCAGVQVLEIIPMAFRLFIVGKHFQLK